MSSILPKLDAWGPAGISLTVLMGCTYGHGPYPAWPTVAPSCRREPRRAKGWIRVTGMAA